MYTVVEVDTRCRRQAALLERYAARAYNDTLLGCARDYAVGHGLGARLAISTGLLPGIGKTLLHNTINGTSSFAKKEQGVRQVWDILTDGEERALAIASG